VSHAVDAVLFDLDNTLADRERAFLEWARWFARERLGLDDPAAIGAAVAWLVALDADGYAPKNLMFTSVKGQYPVLAEDVGALAAAFRRQLLTNLPPLDPGAARLLDALDVAGVPWGIVTNGSPAQVHKVEKLGLADRAACIVVSGVVGVAKPAPAIFRTAAAHIGVAPARIMFVGDHPEADMVGANRVGMQTAWLRRGREWPTHLAPLPDHSIDALRELLWIAGERPASPPRRPIADP
jgi:putative hydrolase of the HAD superfamily